MAALRDAARHLQVDERVAIAGFGIRRDHALDQPRQPASSCGHDADLLQAALEPCQMLLDPERHVRAVVRINGDNFIHAVAEDEPAVEHRYTGFRQRHHFSCDETLR